MKPADLWTRYRITLMGITPLCGSVPADPEIVAAWVKARKPKVTPPSARSLSEIAEEVLASLPEQADEAEDYSMLVFQRHEGACVQRAATFRAHLKDCARVLSPMAGRIEGERALNTRVVNGVYPDESIYWLPILRPDGTPVTKHDREFDQPVHARTKAGMQNSLKRFEVIDPWRIDVRLKVLNMGNKKPFVAEEDLETILTYGGTHGYAGERGMGYGKYTFTLTREG